MTLPPVRRPRDAVDDILSQWAQQRPDLDLRPMGPIGRLKRCAALLDARLQEGFSPFGLSGWEFDMLAALRRAGAPYQLSPTALFSTLMVTSGTMTHRLKQLEAAGWITRVAHPGDARSTLVQLTRKGLLLVNRAVAAHVENEHRILAALPAATVAGLDDALAALLQTLEPAATTAPDAGDSPPDDLYEKDSAS